MTARCELPPQRAGGQAFPKWPRRSSLCPPGGLRRPQRINKGLTRAEVGACLRRASGLEVGYAGPDGVTRARSFLSQLPVGSEKEAGAGWEDVLGESFEEFTLPTKSKRHLIPC